MISVLTDADLRKVWPHYTQDGFPQELKPDWRKKLEHLYVVRIVALNLGVTLPFDNFWLSRKDLLSDTFEHLSAPINEGGDAPMRLWYRCNGEVRWVPIAEGKSWQENLRLEMEALESLAKDELNSVAVRRLSGSVSRSASAPLSRSASNPRFRERTATPVPHSQPPTVPADGDASFPLHRSWSVGSFER